jgi:hypothetical protein
LFIAGKAIVYINHTWLRKNKEKADDNIIEYTMELNRVHFYVLFMIIPVLMVYLIPFLMIWDYQAFKTGWEPFYNYLIPVLLAGIVMHELLHGISWSIFVPGGMRSIRFGIHWKLLAPYCHCNAPMKVRHYKTGTAMPLVILGILPAIYAIGFGNSTLLFFGILFTWAAGGDIISLFMLRRLDNDSYVYDHPHKMGFFIKPGCKKK